MDPIELHSQKRRLTLELDQGIYDYLSHAENVAGFDLPGTLAEQLPGIIDFQLHDGSLSSVALGIKRIRRHLQWRQDIVIELMQMLVNALTNDDETEIKKMVDKHLTSSNPRIPPGAEASTCFPIKLQGRPPRRKALVPVNDTAYHPITIELDGITYGLLSIEARKMSCAPEELALHLLHSFRDENAIREQRRELSRVESEIRTIHVGIRNFVFAVLLKQGQASEQNRLERHFRELIHDWGRRRSR